MDRTVNDPKLPLDGKIYLHFFGMHVFWDLGTLFLDLHKFFAPGRIFFWGLKAGKRQS
jgi:hypothetical protein